MVEVTGNCCGPSHFLFIERSSKRSHIEWPPGEEAEGGVEERERDCGSVTDWLSLAFTSSKYTVEGIREGDAEVRCRGEVLAGTSC